ncbi:hypothetical protein AOLI_G00055770 [Acnodon oligacanthus]
MSRINVALTKKNSTRGEQTVAVVGQTSISDFCHISINIEGVACIALVDTTSIVTAAPPEVVPAGFELEDMAVHLHTVTGELAPIGRAAGLFVGEAAGAGRAEHAASVSVDRFPRGMGSTLISINEVEGVRGSGGWLNGVPLLLSLPSGTAHQWREGHRAGVLLPATGVDYANKLRCQRRARRERFLF